MIVLASSSSARRHLLENAGIAFEAVSPFVDEREIEQLLVAGGASAGDLAIALADAKGRSEPTIGILISMSRTSGR